MSTPTTAQKSSGIKKSPAYMINSLITVAIMLIFGMLPPFAPITQLGMQVAGIFIGLIYGWTTVGLIWPSMLGMILLSLTSYGSINQVLIEGFGSSTVVMILFILIFAAAVTASGVSRFIAMWFVTRKLLLGRPWLFSGIFLFVSFLLSATVNTLASIIICWGILYDICLSLGYKKGDLYPALMILGVTIFATIGMGAFPYKLIPLLVLGAYQKMGGMAVNYFNFVCLYWVLMLVILLGYLLLCRFVFRADVSPIAGITADTFKDMTLTLNKRQKVTLGFLAALILLLLSPSLMPKGFILKTFLDSIGAAGTIMLVVLTMVCVKIDGKPLLEFRQMAIEGIQWDPLILTAAALPVVNALTAEGTGIKEFLIQALGPLLLGRSVLTFAIISLGLALVITNFANNGMTALIFMPVIVSFSSALGADPMAMVVLLIFIVHVAVMTPAACPMAAMLHGNTEWITTGQIYKYGGITVLWVLIVVLAVGLPLSEVLL